jgi:hypothetical protein
MAKIYDFYTGDVLDDFPDREPLLKRMLGKSIGRTSLKLTEESVRSSEERINEAIRIGLAAYQARIDYMTPRSDMSQAEVLQLNAEEAAVFAQLSPAEQQQARDYISSITDNSEEGIS